MANGTMDTATLRLVEACLPFWAKARPHRTAQADHHPYLFHAIDVMAVGDAWLRHDRRLLNRLARRLRMGGETARKLLLFLLLVHDLGKLSLEFQHTVPALFARLRGAEAATVVGQAAQSLKHWDVGMQSWMGLIDPTLPEPTKRKMMVLVAAAFGHHGVPPQSGEARGGVRMTRADRDAAVAFVRLAARLTGFDPWKEPIPVRDRELRVLSVVLSGLVSVCDWIGSDQARFPYEPARTPLPDYLALAAERADAAVLLAGVVAPSPSAVIGVSALFPHIRSPWPLQAFVSDPDRFVVDGEPTLTFLCDQMGAGKTEAGVAAGHRYMAAGSADSLFFALPTQATSNGVYLRLHGKRDDPEPPYLRLFEPGARPSLALAHGQRDLSREFMASCGREPQAANYGDGSVPAEAFCSAFLAGSTRQSVMADFGIGTVDQGLAAVLPHAFQAMRMFGLFRKALVIDEVHAYDAWMIGLLSNLLAFLAAVGVSVVLMSATLPSVTRRTLMLAYAKGLGLEEGEIEDQATMAYPSVSVFKNGVFLTHGVEAVARLRRQARLVHVRTTTDAVYAIREATRRPDGAPAGCAVWFRNTVPDAVKARGFLIEAGVPADDIILFHARFTRRDRALVERRVLDIFGKDSTPEQRAGKIMIATQVAEQSLDLDFDFGISDLAPIDALLQRLGRVMRHDRDGTGRRVPDGAPDQRGTPTLRVLMPDPLANPEATWYADMFWNASNVYADVGVLWRTARIIGWHGRTFQMPDDLQLLVERAYSDEHGEAIPPGIHQATALARQAEQGRGNAALRESIDITGERPFRGHLRCAADVWDREADGDPVGTRYAERPSTVLRLLRRDGDRLLGLTPETDADVERGWRMSEVSLQGALTCPVEVVDEEAIAAMAEVDRQIRNGYVVPVVVDPARDGTWSATLLRDGVETRFVYSHDSGASLAKEARPERGDAW